MQLHSIVYFFFFNFTNITDVHIRLYLVPMADYMIRHISFYKAINDFGYLCVDSMTWFVVAASSYREISNSPSLYLNQRRVFVTRTLGNKLRRNFNQNTKLFIQEDAFENIVYEMAAIFIQGEMS